jgi:hypothetical protein
MRKLPDGFPIVVTLVAFVLVALGNDIFEKLFSNVILHQLQPRLGAAPAELIERLSSIAVPSLIALGVIWGLFGYTRRALALQPARPAPAPEKKVRAGQNRATRDVWLYDAICRIFLGRWDKIPLKHGKLDVDSAGYPVLHDLITQHIRQLAFEGRLPIWGKKQGFRALWEQAPPAFWKTHQIDYDSFLEADPRMLHALPSNGSGKAVPLRELMTNRAAVDAFCESVAL